MLLHSYKHCSAQQDHSYQFNLCQEMFKVFFCKGKALHQGLPCTEKREQATKAVPSLENYEKGQVQSQTPQSALECSNLGIPLASQQHGCKAFC